MHFFTFIVTNFEDPSPSETTLLANNGITFILAEDLNFFEKDPNGNLNCDYKVSRVNTTTQVPTFFVLSKKATCLSGELTTETFKIGSSVPFRKISLSKIDVSEILQVKDSGMNEMSQAIKTKCAEYINQT